MNTSQYMDKQIMDLSNSSSSSQQQRINNNNDFIDLKNPNEEQDLHIAANKKEDILPSYDFQPIRPLGVSSNPSTIDSAGARVWTSTDSKLNSSIRNYGSLDSIEPGKLILEKDRNVYDEALVSEIDQTMKKHADNLLHALEGVSARLSQLETRTRHLENSVDDLKLSVGNNQGSTDGKLRQLEVILREVQTDVEVVKDKQEIMEAQLNLAKLQIPKIVHQSEPQNTAHVDSALHQQHAAVASAPLQSHHHQLPQQLPPAAPTPPQHLTYPPPNAPPPPPPSLQNLPPSLHQFPQNQIPPPPQRDQYYPPPQTSEAPNQQYQAPPLPNPQPPPPALPQQQYQPSSHPQYSQPPPPQPQPQLPHQPEETPYMQSQNYPPTIRQPHSQPPPSGAPPSQQYYGTPPPMYEPQPPSRSSSGFSSSYGSGEQFTYGGRPPSQYDSGSPMKSQQLPSPSFGQGGYPQLPTARILPQAVPTASAVGGGSGSSGTGNRVPIDDVVDRVTNMGFPRDQVRATVRKLTENGQSVDLNVVLDKLMNDGGEGNPQRGWFSR
ncbi:hypothetical protein LguiB_011367 [Lonicera macranthoides]